MDSENKCFHKRPVTRRRRRIAPPLPSDNRSLKAGFPIRKFTDQSLFAAPHDLSQRTTSFIASQRQGIHRIPFRHLIALIARMRAPQKADDTKSELWNANIPVSNFRLPISDFRRPDDSKRPVLLQTHPGSLRSGKRSRLVCSRLELRTTRPANRRRTSRPTPSASQSPPCGRPLVAPSGLDRMRFLFTMSEIENHGNERSRSLLAEKTDPPCGQGFPNTLMSPALIGRGHQRNGFASAPSDLDLPAAHPLGPPIRQGWWSQTGSNRRPHACKARALPTELWPPKQGSVSGDREIGTERVKRPSDSPIAPDRSSDNGGPGRT